MKYPKALSPGGGIALFAPSGETRPQRLAQTRRYLTGQGYLLREHLPARSPGTQGYLAGPDEVRARLLVKAWKDPKAGLLLAIRGGYGASRMMPHLKASDFRGTPKLVAGFSDVSILLNWLADHVGVVALHSPNAATLVDATAPNRRAFWRFVGGEVGKGDALAHSLKVVRGGRAEGRLAGGNLVVLASLVGTPYEVPLAGKILFLEDIHEEPYSIDRALTQLAQGGGLGKVRGVVLGSFHTRKYRMLPSKIVAALVRPYLPKNAPLLCGLPVGHLGTNLPLPIGARVRLDSRTRSLTLLEKVLR